MIALVSALSWLITNWRIPVAVVSGAILCAPLSYCVGKHDAKIAQSAQLQIAAEKVQKAALKAELAANAADVIRRSKSTADLHELQEIVDEKGSTDAVGPALSGVLERLRQQREH
jgi:hypothetical protein